MLHQLLWQFTEMITDVMEHRQLAFVLMLSHFVCAAALVRYGAHSARPSTPSTDNDVIDASPDTCAMYNYSSSGSKFTKVRINMTLETGTSRLKVTGRNMACNATSAALYMLPIATADSDKWQGQFLRCRLVHADPDTDVPQTCFFDCDCASGGCSDIHLTHLTSTSMDGWQLCQIEVVPDCTATPCVNGGTCTDGEPMHTCTCQTDYTGTHCETYRPVVLDCQAVYNSGQTSSGKYWITGVDGGQKEVRCDMVTDGGGWTVMMDIHDGSVDFALNWQPFRDGFGSLDGEFWLGNEIVHHITTSGSSYTLRIDMTTTVDVANFAKYNDFWLDTEANNYTLHFGGMDSGSVSDCLLSHNGQAFQTPDRLVTGNTCLSSFGASWWYSNCYNVLLTGKWGGSGCNGISWGCGSCSADIKAVTMMFKKA